MLRSGLRRSYISILILLLLPAIIGAPANVSAQRPSADLVWRSRAPMSKDRAGVGVVVANNGRIYAIGGSDSTGVLLASVEEYDPATDTWRSRAPMPTPRSGLGVALASNGRIYAIGGGIGGNGVVRAEVEEYDPETNTWRSRAPMPTARACAGVVAADNGRIYVFGGSDDPGILDTVEEYDPATNTWRSLAPMPVARYAVGAAAASNGRIYIVGGMNTSGFLAITDEYDPATDTWRSRAPMPTSRHALGLVEACNGRLYAIAGYDGSAFLRTVEEYDPATDTWQPQTALSTGRYILGVAATNDGRLYAIGGGNATSSLTTVEESDIPCLATPTPTTAPSATATPTATASPTATATPAPITQCWVSPGEERVYRVPVAAFVPYDTEAASDSTLRHITAPPAPVGWNLPSFQDDAAWEAPVAVWWPSWAVGIWARLPEGASPIGVGNGAGQPLGETGLTLLYRGTFTLTPPLPGLVVTRAQLETWSDNKAEWWWQGQSVATDQQGYGAVALYPGRVQAQGGEYTLAVQNSNDLQTGDNPQGIAYRLCVTWSNGEAEGYRTMLPLVLK